MIAPLEPFSHLKWIDDRALLDIEPYRRRIFTETLYTFGEGGTPHYNLALTGRGKKNWKSADLILAALYRFLAWGSPQGNDCFLLANDEGRAGDDLKLLKKVIAVTPCFDLMAQGKRGEDPRMFFSWYSSEFCTDPNYADADPEARANP
jgi:hypothetical protein